MTIMLLRICSLALALLAASPVIAQEEDTSAPGLRIEWAEFKKLYDARKIEVIDVRQAPVYETGHIPRSRSIPLDEVEKRVAEIRKLKKPIVLYCA